MLIRSRSGNHINAYIFRSLALAGINYDYVSIACGAFDPYILFYKILGKRCLRLWTGTDTIKAKKFWDYRIRAKLCMLLCDNYVLSEWLAANLASAGIKYDGVLSFYEHYGIFTKKTKKKT